MSSITEFFNIARLTIKVVFDNKEDNLSLLPSFINFRTKEVANPFISIVVGNYINKDKGVFIDDLVTATGSIRILRLSDGYRCFIRNIYGITTCVVESDSLFRNCRCILNGSFNQRQTGLKTAILLIYSAAASYKNIFVIHASSVVNKDKAYCFLGKSGTGKSTHSDLWIRNFKGAFILNDDSPIIELYRDKVFVWGSPWSGKRNYYINEKAELGAFVCIERAKENSIECMGNIKSFTKIYPSCACFRCCNSIVDNFLNIFSGVIEHSKAYILHCLPDDSAALLCCNYITSR